MPTRTQPIYALVHLLLVLLVVTGSPSVFAKEKTVSLSSTIEPGKNYTTRLNNLEKGYRLFIEIKSNKDLLVLLINQTDFESYPDVKQPVFIGKTSNHALNFNAEIAKTDKYYLVLGNAKTSTEATFSLSITASTEVTEESSEKAAIFYQKLDKLEKDLRRFFIFDELEFKVGQCNSANAYSNQQTVIICSEIASKILKEAKNKQQAEDVLIFAILHEINHVLLRQWGFPFYDNEEVIDEMTTALLIMFNQPERAQSQADYFSALSPDKEYKIKKNKNERHPFSIQRSRNINHWLKDPELVKRWQKIFIPHYQNKILKQMELSTNSWIDHDLVKKELELRES